MGLLVNQNSDDELLDPEIKFRISVSFRMTWLLSIRAGERHG